ncbi:LOW QUALITY PROTEIN: hypothetical protein Cgig2_030572 [Carnegiea gigantea]|uniref:Uncharacterized protein n=1 Tax=Carnegiea gigantea TaxID=171969 RepID=A0A9Q1GQQ9_9CARY|nr:LOW QUALITY PROTEIN: hypothetical protein Cgig2_030572 [Carnegiea gigantea]
MVPVTGLAPPLLGALHRLNCLSHELRDGSRLIILTYIKLERVVLHSSAVASPKGFHMGFPSFRSRTSPQPDSWHRKRKSYFHGHHEARSIVKAIPPQVVGLLGRLLNVHHYTLGRRLIHGGIHLRNQEGIINRQEKMTTRTILRVRAGWVPGNSDPSATISITISARPFRLSTDLPDPNDALEEEGLVDTLSEDELLEECLEEWSRTGITLCALGQQLIGGFDARSRLALGHPTNLEVSHIISYGDLPRIRHLHLGDKDAGGGGILAAGPRGSARFKKGHCIGNLFGFPILILSGPPGPGGRPTLNLPPGHLGSLGPLLHQPVDKAVLTFVCSPCNLPKPQRLTTSDLPTMISYSWPYTREPRLARLPHSAAWRRMSPELF